MRRVLGSVAAAVFCGLLGGILDASQLQECRRLCLARVKAAVNRTNNGTLCGDDGMNSADNSSSLLDDLSRLDATATTDVANSTDLPVVVTDAPSNETAAGNETTTRPTVLTTESANVTESNITDVTTPSPDVSLNVTTMEPMESTISASNDTSPTPEAPVTQRANGTEDSAGTTSGPTEASASDTPTSEAAGNQASGSNVNGTSEEVQSRAQIDAAALLKQKMEECPCQEDIADFLVGEACMTEEAVCGGAEWPENMLFLRGAQLLTEAGANFSASLGECLGNGSSAEAVSDLVDRMVAGDNFWKDQDPVLPNEPPASTSRVFLVVAVFGAIAVLLVGSYLVYANRHKLRKPHCCRRSKGNYQPRDTQVAMSRLNPAYSQDSFR